ncbi:MAG: PTS sugar transporter subunit IIA [Desulfobacterales bacterium]
MKLTIDEVAECLDVPLSTVERWIRQGRIPVSKSGGACIFQKSILYVWAKKHNLPFILPEQNINEIRSEKPDNLFNAMAFGGVYHNIQGSTVSEILASSVENISFLDKDGQHTLLEKLLEREEMASTGIGKGIAIPHPRTPMDETMEEPVITTCFLEHPVDFRAVDGLAVFVLFILLSPSVKIHLHLLSKLAFCVRDGSFVEFLKQSPEEETLLAKIESMENFL